MTIPTTPSKPAWTSWTVWAGLVTTIISSLETFGIVPPGLSADTHGLIGPLGTLIGGVMAIVGRFRAKGPVSIT